MTKEEIFRQIVMLAVLLTSGVCVLLAVIANELRKIREKLEEAVKL